MPNVGSDRDQSTSIAKLARDAREVQPPTVAADQGYFKGEGAHFLTKTLKRVITEISLHVLAYHLKRTMKMLGPGVLMAEMRG